MPRTLIDLTEDEKEHIFDYYLCTGISLKEIEQKFNLTKHTVHRFISNRMRLLTNKNQQTK
jgi:transposase